MKNTATAYWLIPAEPARSFFEKTIVDLARRYNAPVFEPHMTIHVGSDRVEADEVIAKTVSGCRLVQAKVLKVCQSGEFIKTLFVQFAPDRELQELNKLIRDAAQDSSDYQLKPHLSLLYRKMPTLARRQLADLVLSTDPDADRIGAMVPDGAGGFRYLTGNEIAALLTHFKLQKLSLQGRLPPSPIVVRSQSN